MQMGSILERFEDKNAAKSSSQSQSASQTANDIDEDFTDSVDNSKQRKNKKSAVPTRKSFDSATTLEALLDQAEAPILKGSKLVYSFIDLFVCRKEKYQKKKKESIF